MKKFLLIVLAALLAAPVWAQSGGRNQFLGVNGVVGPTLCWVTNKDVTMHNFGMSIGFGLDWAHPVSDNFAIGMYFALGMGPNFYNDFLNTPSSDAGVSMSTNFRAGLLMLIGNVNQNPFILGFAPMTGLTFDNSGPRHSYWGSPIEVRFGRVLNNNLYITGNLTAGVPTMMDYFSDPELKLALFFEPSITIGYNFGPKLKKIRR